MNWALGVVGCISVSLLRMILHEASLILGRGFIFHSGGEGAEGCVCGMGGGGVDVAFSRGRVAD